MRIVSDGSAPDIVTLAVDYYRSPLKYRPLVLPPAKLPEGAGKLLRVACGDGELLAELSRKARVTPSQIKVAAGFFIRQAFFARDADYYRVLGLRPTDDIERIKEHHRLLMKLFHPDRGDAEGDWTDALATRVNQAYTVLRRPDSRREYDASLRAPRPAATVTGGQRGTMKFRWVRVPRPEPGATIDTLPPSVRRHFPELVLGGIGVLAALAVGALYLFEEPPLTGSGAIGGPAETAPANVASKRGVVDTAEKFTTASQLSENTHEGASRGVPPAESVVSLPVPAIAGPRSPATFAPVVIAANESAAATASDTPIAIPAPPEPVVAKTVAPKAPAKAPEAPASAPVPPRAAVIAPPVPVPARTTAETAAAGAALVSVVAAAPAVSRPAFPDLELERLIGRFIGSYELGDIDRFMVLFHEDAKAGEKKDNKTTTRKEYADLFTSTQLRQMMLQGLRWEKGEELARGQGRFLARVAGRGDPHIREYAGSIRVEVENVGGDLLIKGLFHSVEAKKYTQKHTPRGTEGSGAGGR